MAKLVVNSEILTVTSGEKTFGLNLKNGFCKSLELQNTELGRHFEDGIISEDKCVEREKKLLDEAGLNLVCSDISICGNWFTLCSQNKQLIIWKIQDWEFVSSRKLARRPSRVRFTPKCQSVVVADKSGDIWIYSLTNPNEKGTLLLGHLSMLLDVLVTPNEQYIITCDRDEKIRVSCFPNAYNIYCFCLGHEAFVTSLNLLPHDKDILVSSSGDGTLRFWNFEIGEEILKYTVTFDIPNDNMLDVEDKVLERVSIKAVELLQRDLVSSLLCTVLYESGVCIIYCINSKGQQQMCQLVQVLSLDAEPWDISLTSDKILWVVSPVNSGSLNAFVWNESEFKFLLHTDQKFVNLIDTVNSQRSLFDNISAKEKVVALLFKKKYDNVRDYLDKKNERLRLKSDQETKKLKISEAQASLII